MRQTTARRISRVVLLSASVLIALVGAEVFLRVTFERLPLAFLVYAHRDLKDAHPKAWVELRKHLPFLNGRQEDADLGWTFSPGMRAAGKNEDGEPFELTASPEGFFTPSLPDKATPQLVTLGDSFLSTFYVHEPIAWALQRVLRTPVYNLAVFGWGPDNYLAAYRKFATGRRHDRVVVFSFANDITDVLNWTTWRSEEPARESFMTWIQRTTSEQVVNVDDGWLDRSSVLWNLVKFMRRRPQSAATPPAEAAASTSLVGSARATPTASAPSVRLETIQYTAHAPLTFQFTQGYSFTELDPDAFEPGGSYYRYMQAYFESLEQLKSSIADQRAQMILVWIPSKERVYLPLLPPDRYRVYVTNKTGHIDGLERIIHAYAARSGIPFLDLTASLEEHARAGEKLYFTSDGHLNSFGNSLVGELVAHYLQSSPAATPDDTVTPRVIYRTAVVTDVQPVRDADVTYRSPIVSSRGAGWRIRGRADAPYSYVLQWNERDVTGPKFLIAKGTARRGRITIGLQEHEKWVQQADVGPGRFDLALPVIQSSKYSLVIANNLSKDSLDTDIDVTELGWAPIH